MQRYSFDLNDELLAQAEFATPEEAREEAFRMLYQKMGKTLLEEGTCTGWRCVVRDEEGKQVYRLTAVVLLEGSSSNDQQIRPFTPVKVH